MLCLTASLDIHDPMKIFIDIKCIQKINKKLSVAKKDLLSKYDMWTIQKNISRPLAEDENDIEESEWIDLADIKMKYPDKLSALDNMILSDNEFRRKKALSTLIKYVSWPTIPENYNANKENPMDRNKIEYNVTPHDMKSPEPFYDEELNIRL